MALTQAQVLQKLTDYSAQVQKVKSEILAKIDELGFASPELEAIVNKLGGDIQEVDNIVPDAVAPDA